MHGTRRCYAQFGSKSNAAMQVNPTPPDKSTGDRRTTELLCVQDTPLVCTQQSLEATCTSLQRWTLSGTPAVGLHVGRRSIEYYQSSSWLSWYRGVLDVADRLAVVIRFSAGPRVRLNTVAAERQRVRTKKTALSI